ncbi:MAG: sulfurtransferase [Betaproteobacteria bacterium]|nr:sulfurtransferase [Betaproteobacteria bacterium]
MHTPLISAEALHAQLNAGQLFLFDCRHDLAQTEKGRLAYAAGHLLGAYFLHLDEALSGEKTGRNGRHPLPEREAFIARMEALGLQDSSHVVAYDDAGGMYAARLWWMLRWVGFDAVAVLDGGIQAWTQAGFALSSEAPAQRPAGHLAHRPPLPVANADELLSALGASSLLVVDARAADRFRGENETLDPVGGHIPGASNRPFRDNLDSDGRFKSAAQLKTEWLAILAGRRPEQVVAQCGSGVTACHNLLALEIAGLSGARLYPGSWSEWCSDPSRPVARGAA